MLNSARLLIAKIAECLDGLMSQNCTYRVIHQVREKLLLTLDYELGYIFFYINNITITIW